MAFDAAKCTVESRGDKYYVTMTVRYFDPSGKLINLCPVSATVTKGTAATMRTELVATLRPLLDAAVIKLQEGELGTTDLATTILTQVNNYLGTK